MTTPTTASNDKKNTAASGTIGLATSGLASTPTVAANVKPTTVETKLVTAEVKPTTVEAKPETPTDGDSEGTEGEKAANRSKIFIVVGEIHEFTSVAQAEKFLNSPEAPPKFAILRGHSLQTKQRVSLRG